MDAAGAGIEGFTHSSLSSLVAPTRWFRSLRLIATLNQLILVRNWRKAVSRQARDYEVAVVAAKGVCGNEFDLVSADGYL